MVYFMENRNLKWMILGYPYDSGNLNIRGHAVEHDVAGSSRGEAGTGKLRAMGQLMMTLRCHQTWLAGKYTIYR